MGKIKKEKTPDGRITREFSAGGVVFKKLKTQSLKVKTLWLVTKSNPSQLYPKAVWRLPKGWLDDRNQGKNPGPLASGEKKATETKIREAAIREVEEEGGIKVKIIQKIGIERYFLTIGARRILKFVIFYLMEWLEDKKEGFGFETSEIKWLSYEEARKILSYSGEKKTLDKAKAILEGGIQKTLV
jgi:8-oxo-dGTP pyrophosphatase MutT (NUDIX family)